MVSRSRRSFTFRARAAAPVRARCRGITRGSRVSATISEGRRRLEARWKSSGKTGGPGKVFGDHAPDGLYCCYLLPDTRYVTVLCYPASIGFPRTTISMPRPATRRGLAEIASSATFGRRCSTTSGSSGEGGHQEGEIELDPEGDDSLEEGLRKKIVVYDNFMNAVPVGRPVALRRTSARRARARKGEHLQLLVHRRRGERLDDLIILLGRKLAVRLTRPTTFGTRTRSARPWTTTPTVCTS